MLSAQQKSQRRREQNRRAQANLRRKQQERIQGLQDEISSLKVQAQQNCTNEQPQFQNVDHVNGGEVSDFYLTQDDICNNFQADVGNFIPGCLVEDSLPTDHESMSASDHLASCFQQLPTPPCPSFSTTKSLVTPGLLYQITRKAPQCMIPALKTYHCAFDGLAKNASLLGISPESFLSTKSVSSFYSPLQSLSSISASVKHLPPEFQPTMAQLSYPHQPWIDCIPLQDLRSRIIFAVSHRPPFLDSLDLWHDVLSDGLSCAADPKDALLWNMSNDFMHRWQMLLTIELTTLETMCLVSNPPLRKMNLPGS